MQIKTGTLVLLLAICAGACQKPGPLPEIGSSAEQLYAERCGTCHRAYNPSSMTAAMWQVQVKMMQARIERAGQPPLSDQQRQTIVDYLQRNAGKR